MRCFMLLLKCAIFVSIISGTFASAQTIPPSSADSYVIIDVNVIDVEKGIVVAGRTVTISNGRIEKIDTQAKPDIMERTKIINGRGLYLMPGLTDAHVHYLDAPIFGRLMIANGVLLVRDMGMPTEYILKLRDELNRGEILGPEMVTTGAILDGYPPLIPPISLGVKTPEEGRAAVCKQATAGVNMIKVYSTLDKDVFIAIVDESRKLGLKVVGHVPDTIYIEDAAAAGLKSSEHWFGFEKAIAKLLGAPVKLTYAGMGSEAGYLQRLGEVDPVALQTVFQRLHTSGLTVCPTVVTFKTGTNIRVIQAGDFPNSEYISQRVRDTWKLLWSQQNDLPDFIWQNWAQMVKQLNQAGVPLMIGTDLIVPGIIPGYSVHEEMVIWQQAGIPPADVLRSATIVPARFMGLDNRLGSIVEGKTASVVLVRANPLKDIRNAHQIESVFLRGYYLNLDKLNRLLNEAREMAKAQASAEKS
ncbi:MAG: amidohydrolase family protein [Sedimentisphaerales bacterium]|nr:amidohydrolase family protein [Sedimentisphaerales bacterium]